MEPDRIRLTVHPKELGQLTGMELTKVLLFLPIDLLGHRANPSWHNLPYSPFIRAETSPQCRCVFPKPSNFGLFRCNPLASRVRLFSTMLGVVRVCEYAVPSGHARVFNITALVGAWAFEKSRRVPVPT